MSAFNHDVLASKKSKAAPLALPILNLGCGLDVPNGYYVIGDQGQSVLIGGLKPLFGVAGRQNRGKSTLLFFLVMRAFSRYTSSSLIAYDSEQFVTYPRLIEVMRKLPELKDIADDILDETSELSRRFLLISAGTSLLDEFWEDCRDIGESKVKNRKKLSQTMPVKGRDAELMKALPPTIVAIDSLTAGRTKNVNKIMEDNEVDDEEQNITAMRDGLVKARLVHAMSANVTGSGLYIGLSAQIDNSINIPKGPTARPKPKPLEAMLSGDEFKSTGTQFGKLTHSICEIRKQEAVLDSANKPDYPKSADDNELRDNDVRRSHIIELRGKSGQSGPSTTLIVSQKEGYLPDTSMFDYLRKSAGGFSLHVCGSKVNFKSMFYPDCPNITRKNIRLLEGTDHRLSRALELGQELHQIKKFHGAIYESILCDPETLFNDIVELGYDWNELLNTRGYWVFKEDEGKELPAFNAYDALRIRAGTYKPYWMKSDG